MFEQEAKLLLESLKRLRNPEIYHYNAGTHPGISWYIKTVIPAYDVDGEAKKVVDLWRDLSSLHENLVKINDVAFDWNGNRINGWQTVWIDHDIDVILGNPEGSGNFLYEIVDYDTGLNLAGKRAYKWIMDAWDGSNMLSRDLIDELKTISSFLSTFTGKTKILQNRKKIRVL